eukprot:682502-Rhodomonas_salina.1
MELFSPPECKSFGSSLVTGRVPWRLAPAKDSSWHHHMIINFKLSLTPGTRKPELEWKLVTRSPRATSGLLAGIMSGSPPRHVTVTVRVMVDSDRDSTWQVRQVRSDSGQIATRTSHLGHSR